MLTVSPTDNKINTEAEITPLLANYQMLPQFWREMIADYAKGIIDRAISKINCTTEEIAIAYQQFYTQHQITSAATRKTWLKQYGMSQEQLENLATRALKLEKFKHKTWGHKVPSYFLSRKRQLDRVIYSSIRVKNMGVAQELYFRIEERKQPFAELASQYSQVSGGLTGPIELSNLPKPLAEILSISKPGQLWSPIPTSEWLVILRLEKLIPAQLDEAMHQRLLNELFKTWLQKQLEEFIRLMSNVSFF
ncbi:MAG: peptidylprolyl isomerase [Coleofasciculaceae cyanobacterium]